MRAFLFFLLCFLASAASATEQHMCFARAAKYAGVDPDILVAIAKHESGMNPIAINRNKDGTVDTGAMQINSQHRGLLKKAGFAEKDMLDFCTSIFLGAFFVKEGIRLYGNTWRAIGAYNARDEGLRKFYVSKVQKEYYKLKMKRKGAVS